MKLELRKAESLDFEFAFIAKKQAMGPHISSKWGWDEEFQRKLHTQRWNEKPWYVITFDRVDIGTLSLHELENNTLRFGEFYILDAHRNKGLGTKVLVQVLAECDIKKQTVILEYLKWNPVGDLYKRYGFIEVYASDIHYFMERKAHC